MGAVSDWVNMGDTSRMRMWLLAIAVALLGSSALHLAGVVDLSKSIYPGPNFTWLSYIVGGFLFGVGMTLGSGCGSKTLIRVGAGNLKSLVVYIFLGIAAYMTLRGLFGAFRVGVLEKAAITLPAGPGPALACSASTARSSPRSSAARMLAFIYASKAFRSSFDYTLGGVVTGLVVVGGWYVSGHIGHVAEDPNTLQEAFVATNTGRMESFSFVAPFAFTLEYLMLWTDKSQDHHLRHRLRRRRHRRLGGLRARHAHLPLGRLPRRRGHRQPHRRRHADGLRRHHRARLHHRPGDHRLLHAGAGLDHHLRRHRRRLRRDDEVPSTGE